MGMIPIEANAVCVNYVWAYNTMFLLNNDTQPSSNVVSYIT